jgi:hypothetical protein
MKRLLWSTILVALFTVGFGSMAFGSAALELVTGNSVNFSTLFVSDNGAVTCTNVGTSTACTGAVFPVTDLNPTVGAITLTAVTFGGFVTTVTTGGSNSPSCVGMNGPGCLNDTNINTLAVSAGTLSVFFADTSFAAGVPGFDVAFSSPLQTGTLAVQSAFVFTGANPLATGVFSPVAGSLIGATLSSPSPGVVAGATSGANPFVGAFGLELETMFTTTVAGTGFNANGNIAAVPEPAAVALFGTVLALCASSLRRRRKLS